MITTYHQLRQFITTHNVYLKDAQKLSEYQSNPQVGQYYSRHHKIIDIEFDPNSITLNLVLQVEVVTVNEITEKLSKEFLQYTIDVYNNKQLLIDQITVIASEEDRRELQVTRFQLLNAFKRHLVEFTLDLRALTFSDTIIQDFDAERVYKIYCKLLLEKQYVASLLNNIDSKWITQSFYPFDKEEEQRLLQNKIQNDYSHLTQHELLQKLNMINYWITKINYSVILNPSNAIICKQFIITKNYD